MTATAPQRGSKTGADAPSAGQRSLPSRLRDEIHKWMVDGALRAGDRLPSEKELVTRFGVGRSTIREALQLLEQDGVVQAQQGKGRFVTSRPITERPLTRLEGVTDMLASRGLTPTNHVLSCTVRDPTLSEAAALQMTPADPVIELERVRRHNQDAVVYSVDVLPRRLVEAPIADVDWTGSLFGLLAQYDHNVTYATAQVLAVHLDDRIARRIGEQPRQPWLLLKQEHTDGTGRPLLVSHDYHRGSDFAFTVQRLR